MKMFDSMKSVELFTGAGGLAMGCAKAGFHHLALVEHDKHSCHTIRANQLQGIALLKDWYIHQMDVADFDYSTISSEAARLQTFPEGNQLYSVAQILKRLVSV